MTDQPRLHLDTEQVKLWHGDCTDTIRLLPDASIDAVVTDPPYGISFMGQQWDQPGQFGSTRKIGRPGIHKRTAGGDEYATGDTGAMEAGRYDLSPSAMRNFSDWVEVWAGECLRVLKPGGHIIAFGGSRTWHRLATGIEDAGFEIRDSIAWLYGSGMPKSMDVSKAIDKVRDDTEHVRVVCRFLRAAIDAAGGRAAVDRLAESFGVHTRMVEHWAARDTDSQPSCPSVEQFDRLVAELSIDAAAAAPIRLEVARLNERKGQFGEAFAAREVTGEVDEWENRTNYALTSRDGLRRDKPKSEDAKRWEGWGTTLKPAFEPIVVGRKPLAGTVAANILAHGTGGLNIAATRVAHASAADLAESTGKNRHADFGTEQGGNAVYGDFSMVEAKNYDGSKGRHPANVLLDDSQAAALDVQTGYMVDGVAVNRNRTGDRPMTVEGAPRKILPDDVGYGGGGGASRFFPTFRYEAKAPTAERPVHGETIHPTVKPLDLMRWLVRLVTPPGGTVLEPFAGSGTTVEACLIEGFNAIAIEREAAYLPLIEKRIGKDIQPSMFGDWDV